MEPLLSRPRAAVAGLLAGVAAVLTAQAIVWVTRSEVGPVDAVAEGVRDLTPGPIGSFLIHLVGRLDKPLLWAGTIAVLLLACAGLGVLARRRIGYAYAGFGLLAAIALVAITRQPRATLASGIAVVCGVVVWVLALRLLIPRRPVPTGDHLDAGRRTFVLRAFAVGVIAAAVGGTGLWAGRRRGHAERSRRLLRLPATAGEEPAGSSLGVDGIVPWRTPEDEFYQIDTVLIPPSITSAEWRLRIHGLVDREIELGYADLVNRQWQEAWTTIACVSNEVGGDLVGNAWWSGVPIRELLAEAGVQAGADAVLQTSRDGWTCATPLEALTDDRGSLLALAMNGRPLPLKHGFPARMIVPGLYGYVSATKWVVDLELTRFDQVDAYWTQRGWAEKAPIKTQSRIDVPNGNSPVPTGRTRVGGVAWAPHVGIEAVEYQLDGGPWLPADLGASAGDDTWVQWTGWVDLEAGKHTLVVRATDRSGTTQTAVRTDVVPDGATGWHTVRFDAS